MKLLSSHFTAPVVLALVSVIAGCGSAEPTPGNTAGASSGGASSGGKAGSAGSSGGSVSVGGTAAGGSAAGGSAGSVSAGGSAGSGTAGAAGGAAVEATFAHVKGIIAKSCFGAICHDLAENPLQLKPESSLYGTLTTHVTMNCGKLVNLTSPADSALVKILQGSCGTTKKTDRMPYMTCFEGDTSDDNPACIPAADIAAIQAWIAKGAPQQ